MDETKEQQIRLRVQSSIIEYRDLTNARLIYLRVIVSDLKWTAKIKTNNE